MEHDCEACEKRDACPGKRIKEEVVPCIVKNWSLKGIVFYKVLHIAKSFERHMLIAVDAKVKTDAGN
jgi:ribosomal protein L37AE/L43A